MDKDFVTKIITRAQDVLDTLHETPASRITPEMIGSTEASMMMMIDLLKHYRDHAE